MKKITKEEAEAFTATANGWSALRAALMNMKLGEIIHVTRAELPVKRGPFATVSRVTTSKRKFVVKTIAGKQGWLIERTK